MTNVAPLTKRQTTLLGEGENLSSPIKYKDHEKVAVHHQKRRLHQRAQVGKDWDGTAANDNVAWPLATALIREGNTELLMSAMYYRKVHDAAKSEAKLGGSSVSLGDGVALDQRQWVKPNGQVAYKGVRVVSAPEPETTAKRKTPTDSEDQISAAKADSGWSSVPKPWKGDEPVNNMIDAQKRLIQLRSRLGPLVEPFEMSVIDGATYQAVGSSAGIANRTGADGAGRALVHSGLICIRDAVGDVKAGDLR